VIEYSVNVCQYKTDENESEMRKLNNVLTTTDCQASLKNSEVDYHVTL
jgi:hypothetical protein